MKLPALLTALMLIASCGGERAGNPLPTPAGRTHSPIGNTAARGADSDTVTGKTKRFNARYNFERFKTNVFTGKPVLPDFHGNPFSADKTYRDFITEGCKQNGLNFGGHYTLIQRACGAMCEHIFIVDRISGKVFTHLKPNDGRYGYLYRKDSRLLVANAGVFRDDSLTFYADLFGAPELYVWNNDDFKRLQ